MPELPEVETVVRGLMPDVTGRICEEAWVDWAKVLDGLSLHEFNQTIRGQKIKGIHRRGKYICLTLERDFLVVHLRMTGRLYISELQKGDDKWVHFTLGLDDGRYLAFSDARKFGRVQLVSNLDFLEQKLGPEPLGLKPKAFESILRGSKRAIKQHLLDQKRLAGVGNIYADEALHRAKLMPTRPVDALTDPERRRLGKAIVAVLETAINYEGSSISWYRKPDGHTGENQEHFRVYGRTNQPCLTCGTPIKRMVLGQRGTHFCDRCQT